MSGAVGIRMNEKMEWAKKLAYQYPYWLQHKPLVQFIAFAPPQLPSGGGEDGMPHEP